MGGKVDLKIAQWADGLWSVAQYPMFGLTGYITLYVYKEGKKGTVFNTSTGECDLILRHSLEWDALEGESANCPLRNPKDSRPHLPLLGPVGDECEGAVLW